MSGLLNGIDIGALADIPAQGARVVKTRFGCVAIFRTAPADQNMLRGVSER